MGFLVVVVVAVAGLSGAAYNNGELEKPTQSKQKQKQQQQQQQKQLKLPVRKSAVEIKPTAIMQLREADTPTLAHCPIARLPVCLLESEQVLSTFK
ncbi:hypothetical protein AWZ03_010208 [Drosophila navojoa]|uniref:Uncharacterized protein n=1 Tax=Drosophila navojoa TaxID=7232 RepID=A0A484B3I4_DRONA|nr:hypothetical protein AWZ03_010208 [Drosophila navojoa]